MTPRLLCTPWSELCEEERELILALLAESGKRAAQEQCAGWAPRLRAREGKVEGACFDAYLRLLNSVFGDRLFARVRITTKKDLRVAAFCVAFEDERQRLLGLPAVSGTVTDLVQQVDELMDLYLAAMIASEERPTEPKVIAERRRVGSRLALAFMRLNLLTGGQAEEMRRLLRLC